MSNLCGINRNVMCCIEVQKINCQALKHNKIVNECSGEENMNGHKAKGRWEFLIVGKTNDVRIYHKCVESLGENCFCS